MSCSVSHSELEAELGCARALLAVSLLRLGGCSEGSEVGEWKGTWLQPWSCCCCPTGALVFTGCWQTGGVLNKPPLNVSWKSRLCRQCQFLMSLLPSGLSVFSGNSLLIRSLPLWFCDRNNGSGRWGARAPFSLSVPNHRQGRRHLEGEGQIDP